ncbi:hypothetical protein AVEN_266641-1 [Araneus ventricosus]|uniref:Uncharacterized protein n=1 Tax=Araneus ventricosus TaxID=182803 RepID=A0A4Y2KN26_ARAVE|nr:hypothetical protein AVEN_266641-1 [Araneus ventricosus]
MDGKADITSSNPNLHLRASPCVPGPQQKRVAATPLSHLSDTEWDTTSRCIRRRGTVTFYGRSCSLNQSDIRSGLADAISAMAIRTSHRVPNRPRLAPPNCRLFLLKGPWLAALAGRVV